MAFESSPDVKFENGHVLYIDIVGYSKLRISEQSALRENRRLVSAEIGEQVKKVTQ